jgi:hypothetical protein
MVRTLFSAIFWPALLLFYSGSAHAWSTYVELGTSLGSLTTGGPAVGLPASTVTNRGFCGGLSFFAPVTSPKNFFHFELGLQNRMYFLSDAATQNLALITTNLAVRFELYRLYVGGGYSPFAMTSINGPMSLKPASSHTSWFAEGGVIWRVVPELQIVAVFAEEFGLTPASPKPGTEYGLRFRFPLAPYSTVGDASSKFDGFRYPFGFMK